MEGPFEDGRRAAEPVHVLKISQELGEAAETFHGARRQPAEGRSHVGCAEGVRGRHPAWLPWNVSGDGAAVVERQLQGRAGWDHHRLGTSGSSGSSRSTGTWGKSP